MSTIVKRKDPNDYIDMYLRWLRGQMSARPVGGYTEIVTPFLDRHNDKLVIYVTEQNGQLILTDDGYTISDLHMSGCDMNSPARKAQLKSLLTSYGIQMNDDELIAHSSIANFPYRKHMLAQAMLNIGDMFLASPARAESFFFDDVSAFLLENHVYFTPQIQVTGKSGIPQRMDFSIPDGTGGEKLVRLSNEMSKQQMEINIFAFNDVRETRKASQVLIYNDSIKAAKSDYTAAFAAYGIIPIAWTVICSSLNILNNKP